MTDFGMFRTLVYTVEPTWDAETWPIPVDDSFAVFGGFTNWRDGDPNLRFIVGNGRRIWPEFTYENNGADTQTIQVGYYLSDDDVITTTDRRLSGRSFTLGRDWVFTYSAGVNLPNDLIEGRDYYIGAIVDENNAVSEFLREENNAVATGLRIAVARPISFGFNPSKVSGAASANVLATVTLDGSAPGGGIALAINAYPNSLVTFPASVTVPAGQNTATFTITTNTVYGTGTQRVDFTAARAGVDTASGALYIKRKDVSGQEFCDVHPDAILCRICDLDSEGALCKDKFNIETEPDRIPWDEIKGMYGP